jgi:iron complex outermembrane receptor protein
MMKTQLLGVSALALLAASPALAQEKPAAAPTPDGADIVVTATRFETLASKTPIALTAVSGEGLRTAGITNPTALGDQVPSVMINRNNGLQITIRGVTSADGTEKGDPSAAFMADGVYIARQQAQEVSFFDISRVEVLRGPRAPLWPQHHGGRGQCHHQPPGSDQILRLGRCRLWQLQQHPDHRHPQHADQRESGPAFRRQL